MVVDISRCSGKIVDILYFSRINIMFNVLAVGIATVDIINVVTTYPSEDDEVRANNQSILRGGNASNTLVVLSQLGHRCSWAGTIADDPHANIILQDLSTYHIDISQSVEISHSLSPLSCITLSEDSGKRSIIHYRELPELSFEDFSHIDLTSYDWIHFEGRNIEQTLLMLQAVRQCKQSVPVSVEIEKNRSDIRSLYAFADYLFYSRVFVEQSGFVDAPAFLMSVHKQFPHIEHYCAWGDHGAYAIDRQADIFYAPAKSDIQVVDTIGAGDVFNAAIIDAKLNHYSIQAGLEHACEVAGNKCSQYGFSGLGRRGYAQ